MLDLVRQPVAGPNGARATNDVSRKLGPDRFAIDGRELALPMRIADFTIFAQVFAVPTRGVQRMIAASYGGEQPLQLAQLFPGISALSLIAVEYRDNPLGDYNECVISVAAYAPGERALPLLGGLDMLRDRAQQFIYAMPVDQEFTTHAGRFVWGYPKFLAELEIDIGQDAARARFSHDGQLVFAIKAGMADGGGVSRRMSSLTERDGIVRRIETQFEGRGMSFRLGGDAPEIGDTHPLASDLRALGLPKRPLCTVSLRHASGDFSAPHSFATKP